MKMSITQSILKRFSPLMLLALASIQNAAAADIPFESGKGALVQTAYQFLECPVLNNAGEMVYDAMCLSTVSRRFNRLAALLAPNAKINIAPDSNCKTGATLYGVTMKVFRGGGQLMYSKELGTSVYSANCIQNSVSNLTAAIMALTP